MMRVSEVIYESILDDVYQEFHEEKSILASIEHK